MKDIESVDHLYFSSEYCDNLLMKEYIKKTLNLLTERERNVLNLKYGLIDGIGRTLEQVGKIFDCSRTRIMQIEAKALRKLRHPYKKELLTDYRN